jgi:hypothetical protein
MKRCNGETWLGDVVGYTVTTLNRMGGARDHVAVVTMQLF